VGHLKLLINDQTIPGIMSKMPHADWKQWATNCPEWMREEIENAFERIVGQKRTDPLKVAAAEEPTGWEIEGTNQRN
jgi:hypothetical protein